MSKLSTPELVTYHGNCHCGAFKFRVEVPEIKEVTEDDCSICIKRGYKFIYPSVEQFEVERGEDKLTYYEFGPKKAIHKFCSNCGTPVYGQMKDGSAIAVNVRSLKDFDVFAPRGIPSPIDSKDREPKYIPPKFTGIAPTFPGSGHTYTGACHCGAITIALKTKKALTDNPEEYISECNCSICARNGTILIGILSHQITISDPTQKLKPYVFGRRLLAHEFCIDCGTSVSVSKLEVSEEHFKRWEPNEDQRIWEDRSWVNLRCFEGLDWDAITVGREDERGVEPLYEIPK